MCLLCFFSTSSQYFYYLLFSFSLKRYKKTNTKTPFEFILQSFCLNLVIYASAVIVESPSGYNVLRNTDSTYFLYSYACVCLVLNYSLIIIFFLCLSISCLRLDESTNRTVSRFDDKLDNRPDNHWYRQTQHEHNFALNALSIMIILIVSLHVSYHDYLLCHSLLF